MPFISEKQRKFMWAKHPHLARKWTEEMKRKRQPVVQSKRTKRKNQRA
jgi:hypothetical protein